MKKIIAILLALPFAITVLSLTYEFPNSYQDKAFNIKKWIEEKKIEHTKLNENLCNDTNVEQLYESVLQATNNMIENRIYVVQKSIFYPIYDLWETFDKISYHEDKQKDYSRFVSDCDITFPWVPDCRNELIVSGLRNIFHLDITYSIDGETRYFISYPDVTILWNIVSLKLMPRTFNVKQLIIRGTINKMDNFTVDLEEVIELSAADFNDVDYEVQKTLKVLTENGIKQTVQKLVHSSTVDFINVMRKMLLPLINEMILKNSFSDLGTLQRRNTSLGTITFSKIEAEAFHLKNITLLYSENVMIGTLSYNGVKGQAEFTHPIKKYNVDSVPVSADVNIRTVNFSFHYNLNSTNEVTEVLRIDDTFINADTTITITSEHVRLSRENRITIGTQVFEYFVETIRKQIINVTKSTFRSIIDIRQILINDITTTKSSPSNHVTTQQRYFALIRDYWTNLMKHSLIQPVDIIIYGSWNFDSFNVQYVHRKLTIDGLQLRNVTVNIKPVDETNTSFTTICTMSYFSLTIYHTDKDVLVQVPANSKCISIVSISSNISLSDQDSVDTIEKFKSTVGYFIRHLIYAKDLKYQENFQKSVIKEMAKATFERTPPTQDASSKFIEDFIRILYYSDSSFLGCTKEYVITTEHDAYRITRPLQQEEICIYSDHSLQETYNVVEHLVINGTVETRNESKIVVTIPFAVTSNQILMKNFSEYRYHQNLQIYIDNENIEDDLLPNPITSDFERLGNKTVIKKFLRDCLEEYSWISNFCETIISSTTIPESHFYLITRVIDYPMYHIKLYGLQHFESLRQVFSKTITEFEIIVTNLTAEIIWSFSMDEDAVPRPANTMTVQIQKIILCGKIWFKKRIIFSNRSQLLFSDQENSTTATKLKETFKPIVLHAIKHSIQEECYKFSFPGD